MFLKWCGNFALVTAAAIAADLATTMASKAADASWGCQVLLCAASETPSWHDVSYCVLPMTKLIAAMKLPGFSWPICKEGNAGKPGLEPYEPCPAGWTATSSDATFGHGSSAVQNACSHNLGSCNSRTARDAAKEVNEGVVTREIYSDSGHNKSSCSLIQTQPRKPRAKPYYFDIPNSKGENQRFWFDLNT